MSREFIHLLILSLLVIPRFLRQFKLPAPLISLVLGIVAALAPLDSRAASPHRCGLQRPNDPHRHADLRF